MLAASARCARRASGSHGTRAELASRGAYSRHVGATVEGEGGADGATVAVATAVVGFGVPVGDAVGDAVGKSVDVAEGAGVIVAEGSGERVALGATVGVGAFGNRIAQNPPSSP